LWSLTWKNNIYSKAHMFYIWDRAGAGAASGWGSGSGYGTTSNDTAPAWSVCSLHWFALTTTGRNDYSFNWYGRSLPKIKISMQI
jgi:hypothetical protein